MAGRQLRWVLVVELLGYALVGGWLTVRAGWTPGQAAALALAGVLGLRAFIIGTTFVLMLRGRDAPPPALRLGLPGALRMVLEEWLAMLLIFGVVMPFERFWLGPDRLRIGGDGRPPLLLIHGYQCNRGFWFWLRPRLEAAGWVVATHNLEPVFGDIDGYADAIAARVAEVLAATGASQLVLVGHSMGGLAARAYLRRHGGDKVARLVTLGSPHHGTLLAPLGIGPNARQMRVGSAWLAALAPALPPGSTSIYSAHDNYVFPQRAGSTLEGATTVVLGGVGHLAMAFSPRLLERLTAALAAPAAAA